MQTTSLKQRLAAVGYAPGGPGRTYLRLDAAVLADMADRAFPVPSGPSARDQLDAARAYLDRKFLTMGDALRAGLELIEEYAQCAAEDSEDLYDTGLDLLRAMLLSPLQALGLAGEAQEKEAQEKLDDLH